MAKRYSRKRYKTKRRLQVAGSDTDTLDALERGEKYGQGVITPYTYDLTAMKEPKKSMESKIETASEFFDKASEGMKEKAKLEAKYAEDKRVENLLKNTNDITAEELFSGLPPEREKEVQMDVDAYMQPMPAFNMDYDGGRKRKSRRCRKCKCKRKSCKHVRKSRRKSYKH